MVEGATVCYTVLVQFIQLPDHCTNEIQCARTFHYYKKYKLTLVSKLNTNRKVYKITLTLLDCSRGKELALLDTLFSSVQSR